MAEYAIIPVRSKSLSSKAARIAPTRPSIISEGATKSTPASAASIAISVSTSTVASLPRSPVFKFSKPSCPCAVYGSNARSVITTISGTSALNARIALRTRVSGLRASRPLSLLRELSSFGNNATAEMPKFSNSRHSSINKGMVKRTIPGIDSTGSAEPSPSITKTG